MGSGSLRVIVGIAALAVVVGAFSAQATTRGARGLVAHLTDASGAPVGRVRLVTTDDGRIQVSIAARGLTPGFHGYHVHTTGACDPQSKDATGAIVPFVSAGGHFNPDSSQTHGGHAGDLPPLLVTQDGRAMLKFKTDRFRLADLVDSDGSAIIVHAAPDNLANIPGTTASGSERYHSHVEDVFGADTATRATGDAGSRFACGVVQRA